MHVHVRAGEGAAHERAAGTAGGRGAQACGGCQSRAVAVAAMAGALGMCPDDVASVLVQHAGKAGLPSVILAWPPLQQWSSKPVDASNQPCVHRFSVLWMVCSPHRLVVTHCGVPRLEIFACRELCFRNTCQELLYNDPRHD